MSESPKTASTLDYIPYFLPLFIALSSTYIIFTNPGWGIAVVLMFFAALAIAERTMGNDDEMTSYEHPEAFVWMLWAYFPATVLCFLGFIWTMAQYTYGNDLFGIAAIVNALSGFDMVAAHADDGLGMLLFFTLLFSNVCTAGAVSIGHELSHRTSEAVSVFMARGCALFSLFTYYAVEHPFGHHYTVGTEVDSSTALRGESVYQFFKRTTIQDYQTAWGIEKNRLDKLGKDTWSLENRLLKGYLAEATLVLLVAALAGPVGLVFFAIATFNTHFGYKAGVYGQHYGLVRKPGSSIEIHHSWGCTNKVTNWFVDGIGRHAHHHEEPETEFWKLKPYLEGPQYAKGYLQTIGMTLFPKKWNALMTPKLIEWDQKYATKEEREIAMEYNRNSGIPELEAWARENAAA